LRSKSGIITGSIGSTSGSTGSTSGTIGSTSGTTGSIGVGGITGPDGALISVISAPWLLTFVAKPILF